MTPSAYYSYYGPIAQKATKGRGLFASVMLAQAALESAYGQSQLSRQYNNHFGIKADGAWKGKSVSLSTGEYYQGNKTYVKDAFRVYDNDLDSFKDRNVFLASNPRYEKAGVFDAPTPQLQADALQRAGYATDPNYSSKIKQIIADYGLEKYDNAPKAKSDWIVWLLVSVVFVSISLGVYYWYKSR